MPTVLLQFYYEDTVVKLSKEIHVYDVGSLVGDIGGYLGLFLGASALSLFEVAEALVNKVWKL